MADWQSRGHFYRVAARYAEAERLGREALTIAQQHFAAGHGRITEAQLSVGAALIERPRRRGADTAA